MAWVRVLRAKLDLVRRVQVLWANLNPARWSPPARAFAAAAVCFVAFAGLTVGMVTYQVSASQHVFCQLMDTLTSVKPPAAGKPGANPSRAYAAKVAADLVNLKRNLGC